MSKGNPFASIKEGAMHKDLGLPMKHKITNADIAREARKGPKGKKRAAFAMASRKFKHPGK